MSAIHIFRRHVQIFDMALVQGIPNHHKYNHLKRLLQINSYEGAWKRALGSVDEFDCASIQSSIRRNSYAVLIIMVKSPLISIVMPCYNSGKYIRNAVESVFANKIPLQLIVVDDGSRDDTLDVLETYSNRLLLVKSDHAGVCSARNKAIEHIKAPYTLLLDSDDALAPSALSFLLEKASGKDTEVIHGDFSSWDDSMTERLHLHRVRKLGKNPMSSLAKSSFSPPGAVLFSSMAFARVGGFDPSLKVAEDWDFFIRLARTGFKFIKVDKEILYYRRHLASASNQVLDMISSGMEVVRRCHSKDSRITNDMYEDGFRSQDLEKNQFGYYANCLALSSLTSDIDELKKLILDMPIPANPDWRRFGEMYRLSIGWNSIAVQGDRAEIRRNAYIRLISLVKKIAGDQAWGRRMIMSILTPNFITLMYRPGPKKAIRLFKEWRFARQIIEQIDK